jgi:hypothetical protein
MDDEDDEGDESADVGDQVGDCCGRCDRTDVDAQWLWLEVTRPAEEDCEVDSAELAFCSQKHAGLFLQESRIDWQRGDDVSAAGGVRADRFFLGCGLLAIVLSVIGVIALVLWIG